MSDKEKFIELEIADDIKVIVHREVLRLKRKKTLEGNDAAVLEKYAKIYAIIRNADREDIKAGVFGRMEDEQLEGLGDEPDELD